MDAREMCWRYLQQRNSRGVVAPTHRIAEHALRYGLLAQALAAGYRVCANDHRGHGRSVESVAGLGHSGFGSITRLGQRYSDAEVAARHEIFNETNRDEATDDVTGWIQQHS